MHTGKGYRLPEFLLWTRRTIYVLLVLSVIPVVLYQVVGLKWIVIPWGVVFLLGATVALSAGFKNIQTYNRMQDAQQAWSSIVARSRAWGTMSRDYVADPDRARQLVYRHLAWLTALRHQLRHAKAWEHQDEVSNVEYRRLYSVPERERTLESELLRYLPKNEVSQVLASDSRAVQVIALQSAALKELLARGEIGPSQFAELQKALRDLIDEQSRSERIKNFPYPRQHAFVNSLFVKIMVLLLPFGMIGEFEALNESVEGWAKGNMVWMTIPLSLLISWMYTSLDKVGESTENPFEGGSNDVPISRICEEIESELREMLGEIDVPSPSRQASDIAV
ncbi:bestrophin family protein [Lysobacter panacisoli]|uniref:Bestrophin family ion channel n=1 Tax=Lysobacter panacisoli TaxID=1255263 RepID=A0ABP9LEN9_9GAMM|nr:bestrophin family ion channel [Lysobacter panacisoli]